MEKTVTVEKPIVIGDVTLIAVARSSLEYKSIGKGVWLFGMKLPIALVVISDSLRWAFRATGEEVSIDQLMEEDRVKWQKIGMIAEDIAWRRYQRLWSKNQSDWTSQRKHRLPKRIDLDDKRA